MCGDMWLCLVKLKYRAFFSLLRRPAPSSTFSAPTESKRTTSKAENMASKRNHVVEPGIETALWAQGRNSPKSICARRKERHMQRPCHINLSRSTGGFLCRNMARICQCRSGPRQRFTGSEVLPGESAHDHTCEPFWIDRYINR